MTYNEYPQANATRSGIKVSWHYYDDEAKALACAEAAKLNAIRDREMGYDHGYCAPGTITGPDRQNWHPGLWEVCTC